MLPDLQEKGIIVSQFRLQWNWRVNIEWRRDDVWVVKSGLVLNKDGTWEYEPLNSSKTDAWRKRCYHTLDEAIALAIKYVEKEC